MYDPADEKINRLLFTDEPLEDETLYSYILRLVEMNAITDIRWIYRTVCNKKIYQYDYSDNFYYKVDLHRLSKIAGVKYSKVENLHFKYPEGSANKTNGKIKIFAQPEWADFVTRIFPKICPACLAEQNYCRKIWELSFITACPHHNCLLIDSCQNCETGIRWNRPAVNICRCGYDFRYSKLISVEESASKLSGYFHKEFGLPCCAEKDFFTEPISDLGGYCLLKLLCFITSHIYGTPSFSGKPLLTHNSDKKTHAYLCRAIEILDDWPNRYHQFIGDLKDISVGNYFLGWYWSTAERSRLPPGNEIYELINQLQRTILFEEQFSFIHDELRNHFPELPDNNIDFENDLYFVNYKFNETRFDFEDRQMPSDIKSRILKVIRENPSYKDEFLRIIKRKGNI
jgi:hypothetical protein